MKGRIPYEQFFESNPQPMWVYELATLSILAVNAAALRRYGYTREEFLRLTIADLRPAEDVPALRENVSRVTGGIDDAGVWRHKGKDGRVFFVEITSHTLDFLGRSAELVMAVDITERRRAEAAFMEAMKRNELILASTAEGIHGLDAQGRIVFENAAALAMLGYDEQELQGHHSHELIHHHRANGEVYPESDCPIYRTLRDGATRRVENELFFRKNGTSFPVDYTVAAMVDTTDGTVTGAVVNFRDVTGTRREADLRALETRVLDMLSAGEALSRVLGEITTTVDRQLPGVRSSVLLIEDGRLRHGAAAGLPDAYIRAVDGVSIGDGVGSCGTAAWRRKQVVVADTRWDPLWADYRDLAHAFDLRACWSTPVLGADDEVLATVAMHYRTPYLPDKSDQEFIARIGHYVRTAIERHRAAEALKASEERFRALAEHIREVFWITTPDNDRMIYISPAYETIWGRPREELRADPWLWVEAIHPADRDRVVAAAAVQGGGDYAEEYRIIRPDGTVRWIADSGFLVHDDMGAVRQIVGTARDITDRKLAEIALQERLKELGCLYKVLSLIADHARPVESICQAIVDTVPQGLVHDGVAVARMILGTAEYRSPGWCPPMSSLGVEIRRGGMSAGRIEIGYFEPRPERQEERSFLAEERDMMEAIAVHVGDMLDRRELASRFKQSERLNAVGQLTGGVAHDFNNLLTVILGNAELLVEQLGHDPSLGGLAEMIAKAAERGAELTDRLLAFSRRQPLAPRAIDVNRQVADMNPLLRRTLGEHVEIEMSLAAGLWQAMVDPGQLENAFLNLCINASHAMPEGGRLTVETCNVRLDADYARRQVDVAPGPYVMVAVSDSGVGMGAATLDRAFEPFFTTKEVGKGSGLGLSMVYGFVKQSHGHVRIYSEPGQGTTVKLYLPTAATDAQVPESAEDEAAPAVGSERILLVEDDEMVRDYAAGQLAGLGYAVATAASGPEALALLERGEPFDLLFTDMVMPGGMSGRQLADAAAALRPGLPVLFTSGYTEHAVIHQGRLDRGVNLLAKPYRRQELAEKIREVLGQEGTATE